MNILYWSKVKVLLAFGTKLLILLMFYLNSKYSEGYICRLHCPVTSEPIIMIIINGDLQIIGT